MASDAFGSASNPLAPPWASWGSFGAMRALSGGCRNASGSDGDSGMRYSTSTVALSQADYVSGVTDGGPAIHMDSSGNGYIETAYDGSILYAFRLDAGSYTELGHVTGVYTAGQPNKIRSSGTNIILSKNGSDVLTVSDNTYRSGNPGVFAYAGDFIQDNWTDGAAGGYTLAIGQGSYSLTGQQTALRAARRLSAAQGSYNLTGQAVVLKFGHKLTVAEGTYTLNGQAVTLDGPDVSFSLPIETGMYSLVGSDAVADFAITIGRGNYSLTGQPVGLAHGSKVQIGQGSYTLSGQQLAIRIDRRLALAQGSYALSGQDIALTQHNPAPVLTAQSGSYTLTGNQAGLISSQNSGEIFHSLPLNWWTKGL